MSIFKRIGPWVFLAVLLCAPAYAMKLLGVFSGAALHVDTQIETPATNNNAKTLPVPKAGDTIRFQLFAPAGGGNTTNGYTLELDVPGKTLANHVGTVSGVDWNGNALIGRGAATLSALFISGATVPSSGYLGQVNVTVTRELDAGAKLVVKRMEMTSGRDVDQLAVGAAEITFAAGGNAGDFNNDGNVDLSDFLAFASMFGTSSGEAGYDARGDFDNDGSINLSDFLAFAITFGATYPVGGGGGGQGGTPAGIAPADQSAFNSLVVGNRLVTRFYFVDFVSAGRFTEDVGRLPGSYTYTNTGTNTGTVTQEYDQGEYGGRCVMQLTFNSSTTGDLSLTCDDGITADEVNWRLSDLSDPVFARATADSLYFGILDTWRAGETRAYDIQIRRKTPQGSWIEGCLEPRNASNNTVTQYYIAFISGREPNTTYEMRYRYRNSSSCNTGSPDTWSTIVEGTTTMPGEGGSDDHGNSRSDATSLSPGNSSSGRIETGGDVDYFSVQVGGAGTLTVYSTGSTDTYGTLYDDSGTSLDSDDDSGSGGNFSIERTVSSGTYYVEVKGYDDQTTGSYTVHAGFSAGSGGGGSGNNLGACTVGMVVKPNQRCSVGRAEFINIGGGCYQFTAFGTGRFCSSGFNLNGLQGTRSGNDYRITAVP